MDASEFAAVVVAITSVVAVTLLVIGIVSLSRTLAALRLTIEELRRETLPVVENLQRATERANDDLDRMDQLLVSAESISATVDSASRLAYLTFSNPVIKVLAFAAGTNRAMKALRRGDR